MKEKKEKKENGREEKYKYIFAFHVESRQYRRLYIKPICPNPGIVFSKVSRKLQSLESCHSSPRPIAMLLLYKNRNTVGCGSEQRNSE